MSFFEPLGTWLRAFDVCGRRLETSQSKNSGLANAYELARETIKKRDGQLEGLEFDVAFARDQTRYYEKLSSALHFEVEKLGDIVGSVDDNLNRAYLEATGTLYED